MLMPCNSCNILETEASISNNPYCEFRVLIVNDQIKNAFVFFDVGIPLYL